MPIQGGGGGDKNPLRTILTVVVAVAAIAAITLIPTMSIFTTGMLAGWGGFAGGLAGMAISIGGMLLVNQIAPPSMPKLGNQSAGTPEKVWSIDGIQNRADLYGMVPLVMGRVRFAPRYAAQPYTMLRGSN